MPVSLDDVRRLADQLLDPGRFFSACPLREQHVPAETSRWEVFQGRLLDAAQTRQEATFEAWNVFFETPPSAEPVLSLKLDAGRGRLYVVRGVEGHVWEPLAEGNVITTRPARRWLRELIATFELARFDRLDELGEEVECALARAVTGTRLPLTPVEAPHPAFSFGRLYYGPTSRSPGCQPVFREDHRLAAWATAEDLLSRWLGPALHQGQASRLLEAWLRALPAVQLPRALRDLWQRWSALGRGAAELMRTLRQLFNDVSLSPWTDLVDKVLHLLALLEQEGAIDAAGAVDFEGHLLRLVCRHLTAYDLVTFHHRGANYPDALLLEAVLADYLARIERVPGLFAGETGRLRRRALRQAYLLRRRYEGHPVPDVPTSPGEHGRVFPDDYPRVPEEQILQPARRQRRLYADEPLLERLGPAARELLRLALTDLGHPAEVQEMGAAVFLDRPFGAAKAPVEPDGTLLLASLAYSPSVARQRLRLLGRDVGAGEEELRRLAEGLELPGLGLEAIGPPVRPGTLGLADAALAGPDFVFRYTLPGSVRALAEQYDFGAFADRLSGQVLIARAPRGPGLVVYDAALKERMRLEPCLEHGYASRRGLEYPADGLAVTAEEGAALPEPVVLRPGE